MLNNMKTLIINPPGEKGFDRSGRWPAKSMGGTFIEPLFLAYTAAVLEKEGLPVELIDCRPFYISQEELLEKIDENAALAVLQTSTPSIDLDLDTAKKIKNKFPKIKIALVGSHVTILDKEIMENNEHVDFVVRREYEYTIRDLAREIEPEKILGITFRKNGEIVRNPDRPYIENLDELPFPARHLLPMHTYFDPMFKSRMTFRLMGSRGCVYQCTFCLWPQTMYGRRIRFRDPKKIVDEIEYFINNQGARGFYFEDDTFTTSPKHVEGVCNELLRRKIKISWSCLGRVDTMTEEMLKMMKMAGCYMIRVGIESSSQEILDRVKKGITIEQIVKSMKMMKKIGIKVHASYVLGLPGETKETLEEDVKFAIKLDNDYGQFGMAVPYPGTEMYKEAEEKGWLRTKNWKDYDAAEKSVREYPN
jgi:anaerobic magnesium-protoporphyrin IX monomethyl ester cyclase